jgi:hypothetical protein
VHAGAGTEIDAEAESPGAPLPDAMAPVEQRTVHENLACPCEHHWDRRRRFNRSLHVLAPRVASVMDLENSGHRTHRCPLLGMAMMTAVRS